MSRPPSSLPTEERGTSDLTDPVQFAAQFSAAYRRLTLVAAGVTGDRGSAEDIVQEAAVIAYEKAAQFVPGTNFAAWMAEIVRRCALNHRRKARSRRTYAADPVALDELNSRVVETKERSPVALRSGALPDQDEFDDRLAAALNELGEEARSCLLLRTVEGLAYAEISELLGIPEGTATSHVHRSRQTLRRRLSSTELDPTRRSPSETS